ncbi:hypothetical protein ACFX12_047317 [Malus domestica]
MAAPRICIMSWKSVLQILLGNLLL